MFPRKLDHNHLDQQSRQRNVDGDFESNYEISDSGYGKDNVKILHIQRNGTLHNIKEFEVNTHLKLYSKKDYLHGDNEDIVATDSQKNTVYLLAKQFGVKSPEEFGLLLVNHFLTKYRHVEEAHVHIEEYPWKRINYTDSTVASKHLTGIDHHHAFVFTPITRRFCDVIKKRNEKYPIIMSGLKNLRVLKTTQSSFVNFVNDEYRSLPDTHDRVFSTNISSSWQYSNHIGINFDHIWNTVRDILIENFAGDLINGIPSPSVQNTIYLAQTNVLQVIKEISTINIEMPNIHYFAFDTSKHPKLVDGPNNEVFLPVDKPSGIIYAQLKRKDILKKYPIIMSGLKNLRVLKTTQSSFVNFVNDEYRSLPDTHDRVFSTNISSSWQYSNHIGINFDHIWNTVRDILIENFAGDLINGIPSPSVQNTIYLAQTNVLQVIKEISTINIEMPNIHYFAFDTSKHPKLVDGPNNEVFLPVDKPSGIIYAQLKRKDILSKL